MRRPREATIEDLAAIGQEMAEEHLVLAAGGRMKDRTYKLDISIVNGRTIAQLIPD